MGARGWKMPALLLALALLLARESLALPAVAAIGSTGQEESPELAPGAANATEAAAGADLRNATLVTYISGILRDLPALRSTVIAVCSVTALLILCLVIRICRSGKKIRKTRKYDIITTPAERVEMAPLNEENDDDEDATVFDVKYRYR
ncbi:membrane protein FAM174B-like [Rhinatrema bivittatum]|uniref:membrane protein FAM174B-like n=1 Tax=Rhinatrema bivittatum TaxID=194408 RepID=UPI00112BAB60|nr:membrane protein FAM174B-like [Rhinatrema bivittatum]